MIMKTKLLHRLRVKASKHLFVDEQLLYSNITAFSIYYRNVKLFTETCTPDEYEKVKKLVFKKCDRLLREYILKELEKYR